MRGNCLDGIALLSLAQAPVAGAALPLVDFLTAGGAPGGPRAAHCGRSEPSNGLEPFRRPLGGFGRAVEAGGRGAMARMRKGRPFRDGLANRAQTRCSIARSL
jgi:hypothetical protein